MYGFEVSSDAKFDKSILTGKSHNASYNVRVPGKNLLLLDSLLRLFKSDLGITSFVDLVLSSFPRASSLQDVNSCRRSPDLGRRPGYPLDERTLRRSSVNIGRVAADSAFAKGNAFHRC